MVKHEFVADAVQLISGDTRANVTANLCKRLGGDARRHPDSVDDFLGMDIATGPTIRALLAHKRGPGDVRWN